MFKNYLKLAWRSLLKNKVSSFINIAGLAVGLATGIIIMLVVADEFSYDRFHTNLREIYFVMKNQKQNGGIHTGRSTAGPLAPALRHEMPEVKYAARVADAGDQLVRVGDKSIYESAMYAEPEFFNMMSFPAIEGNPVAALQDASSAVITERTAKRLFGNESPIGKTFVYDNSHVLKVAAVLQDVPANSSIQFDIAIPFRIFEAESPWLNKWDDNRIQTWAQLVPSANIRALNEKLTRLLQTKSDDAGVSLFVYPFKDMRLYGNFNNGKPDGGKIYMVGLLAILGLFILGIACINFMNLATARSEYRGREVGVRKVLGAARKQLILQFLSEALVTSFLALLLAVLISQLVLPVFNQYTEKNIRFNLGDWRIWASLLGIGLFTGLLAGSYPAFFLSNFKTVRVLKGVMSRGKGGGGFRRVLVTIQFFVSIFFIVGIIVFYVQTNYVKNRPLGYDQENLIDITASGDLSGKFDIFKNELAKISGVKNLSAGSDNLLQYGSGESRKDWTENLSGHEIGLLVTDVQYNWIKTAGLKLMEGRDFSPEFGTDTSACLINQATIESLGLKEPVIGTKLGGKAIIGVFQNFVFNNPSGIIAPMVVSLNTDRLSHFFVRIQNDGRWRKTLAQIQQVAKKINPDYPFEFYFTKENYQKRFEELASYGFLASLFGGMAIFISCLGLFGLSAFLAERRGKEMSIRKVFGASIKNVWLSLSEDFLKPVLIAFLFVIPIATWSMQTMLSNITYHINLSWWMFAIAGLSALLIALLTVSYQGLRTALENPAVKLRSE
jgi:putative ABC transport system permease protein